jgi:hypothetical protein
VPREKDLERLGREALISAADRTKLVIELMPIPAPISI